MTPSGSCTASVEATHWTLQIRNDTSVVCRSKETEDAIIQRVNKLPKAATIRRKQGFGRLHASRWMEDVIAFSQAPPTDAARAQ